MLVIQLILDYKEGLSKHFPTIMKNCLRDMFEHIDVPAVETESTVDDPPIPKQVVTEEPVILTISTTDKLKALPVSRLKKYIEDYRDRHTDFVECTFCKKRKRSRSFTRPRRHQKPVSR